MLSEKPCANLQQPYNSWRVRVLCNINLLLLPMLNGRVESQSSHHRFARSGRKPSMLTPFRKKEFIDPSRIDVD